MFSSAEKQFNLAKGDLPYAFSLLPQESCAVSIQGEPISSQAEENSPQPNPPRVNGSSATRLFKEIIRYAGLLACMGILFYGGYRRAVDISFTYPSPVLDTNSLTISNLNILNSKLVGVWDVNITFGHSFGDDAEVTFYDLFAGSIYYKQVNDTCAGNLLANVNAMTIYVQQKERTRVHLKFANTGWEADQPVMEEQVIQEIGKELENGVLHFSLEIDFQATFQKWGELWSGADHNRINRYCWDLMAGIDRPTGKGRLIDAKAVNCD
ncbi:hypothetical protein QQP08_007781 [Theobroma cacao]|nr:hypothetical protein QQP08_007781 [Theobroma cacao]